MNTKFNTIEVSPTSHAIGAEISGVDIAAGVIFFRDQDIAPDQHIEFARQWGEININRFFRPVETHPLIAEVRKEPHHKSNIGAAWYTDHSYDQIPAMGSILYARAVPELGGDTMQEQLSRSGSFAYRDVGKGREHGAEALPTWM